MRVCHRCITKLDYSHPGCFDQISVQAHPSNLRAHSQTLEFYGNKVLYLVKVCLMILKGEPEAIVRRLASNLVHSYNGR